MRKFGLKVGFGRITMNESKSMSKLHSIREKNYERMKKRELPALETDNIG
jgi:hypothetical protein